MLITRRQPHRARRLTRLHQFVDYSGYFALERRLFRTQASRGINPGDTLGPA